MARTLGERIETTAARLAQLNARERLLAQAEKARAKKLEKRQWAKTIAGLLRSADAHRKIALGGVCIAAGVDDFDAAELCGMLLDARDRVNHSPTVRLALKKRGVEHLDARKDSRDLKR
jgi:hypothetical protein